MHIHPFNLDQAVAERRTRLARRTGHVGRIDRRGTRRGRPTPGR